MKKWTVLFIISAVVSGYLHFRTPVYSEQPPVMIESEKVVVDPIEKPKLILFTDTRRCPPCKRLHADMTKHRMDRLRERWTVVIVDFGRDDPSATEPLSRKYHIWGTPTVVANGKTMIGTDAVNFLMEEMAK